MIMSRSYEERREEERRYQSDVFYEVWRSGGNPDRINDDRVSDRMDRGYTAEENASAELRAHRESAQRRREEEEEQHFPEEQQE